MDNSRIEPFGLVLGAKTLVSTIHSCHYFIPTDDVLMLPNLVIYRNWEAELSDFVKRNLQVETTFIDIGSNFGYFAVLAKQCRGAAEFSNIIAFEPNPKMFDLLQENMQLLHLQKVGQETQARTNNHYLVPKNMIHTRLKS